MNALSPSYTETLSRYFVRKCPSEPLYWERLKREFALIKEFKFEKTFLQVREILKLAEGIPHIIRGSAGSSLVCYLMGITNIDPIKENVAGISSSNRFFCKCPSIKS